MPITFAFFHDIGLTQQNTSGNPFAATQDTQGTLPPVDHQVWFGSNTSGVKIRADSNPGVDQITVSVVDANTGAGEPASAVKLATTQGGLDAATPGAPLSIGTQVNSGVGSAVSFWARMDDATATVGTYTDLSLDTNILREEAI